MLDFFTFGIGDVGQVPHEMVLVARELAPGERLVQQLIDRIVGEENIIAFGSTALREIAVVVVGIKCHPVVGSVTCFKRFF